MFPRPTRGAQFIIASWSFPDEYGQGIYRVQIQENSTGSFLDILNSDTGSIYWYYNNSTTAGYLNYTAANTSLFFDVQIFLNYTNMGLTHPDDNQIGRNFIRTSISLFLVSETLFFQQNLTYDAFLGQVEPSIWAYSYTGLVDARPLIAGGIYVVVLAYDTYLESVGEQA